MADDETTELALPFADRIVQIGILYMPRPITFQYTNYAGVESKRTVLPLRFQYGTTPYHKQPTMLLKAFCMDRKADRTFAVEHMSNVEIAP